MYHNRRLFRRSCRPTAIERGRLHRPASQNHTNDVTATPTRPQRGHPLNIRASERPADMKRKQEGNTCFLPARFLSKRRLSTQAEFLDDGAVTLDVNLCEIVEHTAATAYQHFHGTARGVILVIGLEVLGEVIDTVGEEGNLSLGAAGILGILTVLCEDFFFLCRIQIHNLVWFNGLIIEVEPVVNTALAATLPNYLLRKAGAKIAKNSDNCKLY